MRTADAPAEAAPHPTGPSRLRRTGAALAIGLSLFELAALYVVTLPPLLHLAVFFGWSCVLLWFTVATRAEGARSRQVVPVAMALLVVGAGVVLVAEREWIPIRWPLVDALSPLELAAGVVVLLAVVEVTRRAVGPALVGVMAVFAAYTAFGHLLDGFLWHRALSPAEVVDHLVFTNYGVFGAPMTVAATYVYVFVILGTALERSGGGDFLFGVARAVAGRAIGGPAKVAVVSSAMYGSISGSPTSNVMTTGLFTIPMMIRSGVRPEVAAGIEAVAATGGALLPPVMGSAAFLMAELTGISYFDICMAAVTPGLLFYFSLFMQVHFAAARTHGAGPPVEHPGIRALAGRAYHLVPLLALIGLLAAGWSAIQAAGLAILLAVATSWGADSTRIGWGDLLRILDVSAHRSLVVTAACGAAGVVVGAIVTTGLGGKVTGLIFASASGSLLLALVATMGVCTLLGMGVPVPSAYVITAVLAGPPLASLGIDTLTSHLFVLYYASLSAITPPVAVAAFAAASIAGVNPTRVGLQACRLGLVAFILPFFFVYRPELLLIGSPMAILQAIVASVVGSLLIAGALEGFVRRPVPGWERVIMFAAGIALIVPGVLTDIIGALVGGAVFVRHARRRGDRDAEPRVEPA